MIQDNKNKILLMYLLIVLAINIYCWTLSYKKFKFQVILSQFWFSSIILATVFRFLYLVFELPQFLFVHYFTTWCGMSIGYPFLVALNWHLNGFNPLALYLMTILLIVPVLLVISQNYFLISGASVGIGLLFCMAHLIMSMFIRSNFGIISSLLMAASFITLGDNINKPIPIVNMAREDGFLFLGVISIFLTDCIKERV